MQWEISNTRSGVLCNRRLPNTNSFYESLEKLDKMIISFDKKERDYSIEYYFVQSLRNYQSILMLSSDNNEILNSSKKIIDNLNNIKNNYLDIFSSFEKNNVSAIIGEIKSFIHKATHSSRDKRTISSQIDYLRDLFKKEISTYPHSFLSDFSRITFSSSFRRLQDKTQVFPLEKYDFARTRLTHSIEVMSIAMQLGNLCGQACTPKNNALKKQNAFLYEKILNCAAIIHDMGNPPFGHFGEDAIRDYFNSNWDSLEYYVYNKNISSRKLCNEINSTKKQQLYFDFINFDGNAQSLHVISKLLEYKSEGSLDLTVGILGAIIKYPCNSIQGSEKKKFGFFYSENDIIKYLKNAGTYHKEFRNPLALILESADDISYVTSDLVDAVKKGALKYQDFVDELENINFNDSISIKFRKDFHNFYLENKQQKEYEPFEQTISRMSNDLRNILIKEVIVFFSNNYKLIKSGIYYNIDIDKHKNNLFCVYEDGTKEYSNEILKCIPQRHLIRWIQDNLFKKYIYNYRNILESELTGYKVIHSLLSVFVDAILKLKFQNGRVIYDANLKKQKKVYDLISPNYIKQFELNTAKYDSNSIYHIYYRLKLVIDYICGMTDSYALNLYQIINGII